MEDKGWFGMWYRENLMETLSKLGLTEFDNHVDCDYYITYVKDKYQASLSKVSDIRVPCGPFFISIFRGRRVWGT